MTHGGGKAGQPAATFFSLNGITLITVYITRTLEQCPRFVAFGDNLTSAGI